MWSRAIFLRYGRNFNAVWQKSEGELVATKVIRPGFCVRLEPPKAAQPAQVADAPAKPAGGRVRIVLNDREMLRRKFDVENESWCD